MKSTVKICLAVGIVAAGSLAIAMGPLDPPAGPVTSTSPSLADIESLILSQSSGSTNGPWKVHVIDANDGLASQNSSIEIAPGKQVILHSINAYRVNAYAFDGPGLLSGAGTVSSGDVVGQVVQIISSSVGGGTVFRDSNQAQFDVLCENGLEIAWTYDDNAGYFIHVYYKEVGSIPVP